MNDSNREATVYKLLIGAEGRLNISAEKVREEYEDEFVASFLENLANQTCDFNRLFEERNDISDTGNEQ